MPSRSSMSEKTHHLTSTSSVSQSLPSGREAFPRRSPNTRTRVHSLTTRARFRTTWVHLARVLCSMSDEAPRLRPTLDLGSDASHTKCVTRTLTATVLPSSTIARESAGSTIQCTIHRAVDTAFGSTIQSHTAFDGG